MFDCSLFFYCHCHKSSPQNLLISEIQKAQKQEPFFLEAAALKTSGNLKELMILLSFLPRAIMKLFYKRAAAPIIQIIPFSCSAGAGKKGGTTCSVPRKGARPRRVQVAVPGDRDWQLEQEILSWSSTEFIQDCAIS